MFARFPRNLLACRGAISLRPHRRPLLPGEIKAGETLLHPSGVADDGEKKWYDKDN
jgi:hypothetical protein